MQYIEIRCKVRNKIRCRRISGICKTEYHFTVVSLVSLPLSESEPETSFSHGKYA